MAFNQHNDAHTRVVEIYMDVQHSLWRYIISIQYMCFSGKFYTEVVCVNYSDPSMLNILSELI